MKGKVTKVSGSDTALLNEPLLHLRLCPWYFKCVVMYARYNCHHLVGTGTEAELLVELLMSRAVLLQCGLDPLSDVQGLGSRIIVLLEKAALYLCC